MGRMERQKGKTFERLVVHAFREVCGPDVKRGIGQARAGGEVPDVDGVPAMWIECKHHRRVNVRAALVQAEEAEFDSRLLCRPGGADCSRRGKGDEEPCLGCRFAVLRTEARRAPLAVCRDNGKPIIAVMYLEDFLALLRRASVNPETPPAPVLPPRRRVRPLPDPAGPASPAAPATGR